MKLSKSGILHKLKDKVTIGRVNEENVENTLRWYDKQIEKNPKDTGLYYAKAALLAKEGRYEESIHTLDRIIELDPDNEKVWYIKANTLYELQRYEEAIKCFDRILEFAEKDERAWFHKGGALSKLERYKEAIECFDKAIDIDRNYTEAWLGRGNALRKLRSDDMEEEPEKIDEERKSELEDALKSYIVVTDLNPNSEQAWHGKGNVFYKLGRYEEALPCYDRCIEIYPDYIRGWYDRGKTLQKLSRKEEATLSFETAIGFSPNDALIKDTEDWGARAYSFYELGRYEEALECFDKILEKYPDNHYALEGKGTMLERLGRREEALQCYRDTIKLSSDTVSGWYRIGTRLSDAGDYDAAIECYNEAVQLAPEFEEAWCRIGELLRKQNNHEKAKECYSWILEINPDNMMARNALSALPEEGENIEEKSNEPQGTTKEDVRKVKLRKFRRKNVKRTIKMIEESPAHDGVKDIPIEEAAEKDVPIPDETQEENGQVEEQAIESSSGFEGDVSQENASEEINKTKVYDEIYAYLNELEGLLDQKTVHLNADSLEGEQPDVDEGNIEKLVILGRAHLERREFGKALGYFDRALELDPQYLDAWIAKGDVFLEMGKIGGASSCYKKGAVSPLKPINGEGNDENPISESTDNEWRDTLISFLEDLSMSLEGSEELNFDCPKCGSMVNLDEKLCPGCSTTFLEEEFKNDCKDIEDDLMFFNRLRSILSAKIPTFIHLDGANGIIRFLEKRIDDTTGKFDYILIRGEIEKLSRDYSFKQRSRAELLVDRKLES